MAKEKKMNNEELEDEKKETKGNEPEDQGKDNQDKGAENPPAEVKTDEKKGFHPIQALKAKKAEFDEKHPKIASGLNTAGKVAAGVGIGAVGTIAVLASIAKATNDANADSDEADETDDDDIIDSEATELDDSEN